MTEEETVLEGLIRIAEENKILMKINAEGIEEIKNMLREIFKTPVAKIGVSEEDKTRMRDVEIILLGEKND